MVHLERLDDERLSAFRDVGDAELRRQRGECLVEGRIVVRRLLQEQPDRARVLLLSQAAADAMSDALAVLPDLAVYVVPTAAMQAITGFNLHRGCLAVASRGPDRDWRALLAQCRRVLLLEGVGNPDNVGGLFRTARALGVDAVLLGPGTGDPLYRKAIRVSCGASLVVPFADVTPWPSALTEMARAGFAVWALTPDDQSRSLDDACDAGVPERLAVMVGAEGPGLSESSLGAASRRVRIPINRSADSLNVVVAAGIVLASVRSRLI